MKKSIFWFRRDLRLKDNCGLHNALEAGAPVKLIFIFDEHILSELENNDPRVNFIYDILEKMNDQLSHYKSGIAVYHGKAEEIWQGIIEEEEIDRVYINKDYEPYAIKRDKKIEELLQAAGIELKAFKDQVIYEENDVLKDDGDPYIVYTPYMKKWRSQFDAQDHKPFKNSNYNHFYPTKVDFPSKQKLGIKKANLEVPDYDLSAVKTYDKKRDYPSIETTRLGPHLRFGTVSVRELFNDIDHKYEAFRNELIWREFFMQILFHYPKTVDQNFKSKYDGIEWRNNEEEFEKWCQGKTGYPIVDAGMRQLNETGFMHNRVRMVTASFLCKHLLIHWSWGEAYFANKLLDFELSSNVGNWQWVAGTGVDAAPYFRIFNPSSQQDKYDKDLEYVNTWIPEYGTDDYPEPMVDHKDARERCLEVYKKGID